MGKVFGGFIKVRGRFYPYWLCSKPDKFQTELQIAKWRKEYECPKQQS